MSDSGSNAETAWERYRDSEIISNWDEAGGAFIAGYEARDAEVAALTAPVDYPAFKSWLARHDVEVKIAALRELVAAVIPDWDADDWILRRADQMERELTKPQTTEETR